MDECATQRDADRFVPVAFIGDITEHMTRVGRGHGAPRRWLDRGRGIGRGRGGHSAHNATHTDGDGGGRSNS